MALNIGIPETEAGFRPQITVVGVGGAGSNAVNNMIRSQLQGVHFVVANTDAQALGAAESENRIQLGAATTGGLGAGSNPEVGRLAAEESFDEITQLLKGANMVFITAGMGGGTGTGAAPVVAKAAKELGILTVAVVTRPFLFEGAHRMRLADSGLQELEKQADTLIVIPNQNLFRVADEKTTFADAFKMADDVLHDGVRGITDLMVMPGLVNLDFADIRSVMSEMGKAMMGVGEGEGEKRAIEAAEKAISNPLLEEASMQGAKGVLINISGGTDLTLYEVDEAANRIREEVDPDANIIFGSIFNEKLVGKIRISVVATGIDSHGNVSYGTRMPTQPPVAQRSIQSIETPPIQTKKSVEEIDQDNFIDQLSENALDETEDDLQTLSLPEEQEDLLQESIDPTPQSENATIQKKKRAQKAKPPSLFERMANGLARSKTQEEENIEPSLFDSQIQFNDKDDFLGEDEDDEDEEYLDIPAFLRRKKD